VIERIGGAHVTYSFWLLAFLPASVIMVVSSWALTLWLFPPEVASLEDRKEEVRAHFRTTPWTPYATKSTILVVLALGLWFTDSLHGISAALVAFGVGLIALLPFVDLLDGHDFRKANFLPFFFVAAALGMSEVLSATGGLALLTDAFMNNLEGLLQNRFLAVPAMYVTAFVYHLFTASEISMLATSLPVLMNFSKSHGLDPLWMGMVWSFSATGKLFVYQAAPLVVGYSYGYFRHVDLIRLGGLLTAAAFLALCVCVFLYWPLLHF
jgi:di/tricarboxylate transporter